MRNSLSAATLLRVHGLTVLLAATLSFTNRSNAQTASPTPANVLGRLSTRAHVQSGDNNLISGFIVTGSGNKKVVVRGLGPSLGLAGSLADPVLTLHGANGDTAASNDNWKSDQQAAIANTGQAPAHDAESAILATLPPGGYTAVLVGKSNTAGIGNIDVIDVDTSAGSQLDSISSRAFAGAGNNVIVGAFRINGPTAQKVIIRGIGPSLNTRAFPVPNAMQNPTLELRDSNNNLLVFNDNWRDTQEQEIIDAAMPPSDNRESAILATLAPGSYTATLAGACSTTGIALVEVYNGGLGTATGVPRSSLRPICGPVATPTPSPTASPSPTATATPSPTSSPAATPTPTPTPTPGASPAPSSSPTVSPSPTPASRAQNISARLTVLTGDNVLIGGFIIRGPAGSSKTVALRGIGPSLADRGVQDTLADPTIELHRPSGSMLANDNWKDAPNATDVPALLVPGDERESVLVTSLPPDIYTVVVKGADGGTGVGLAEVYDLDQPSATQLANISTRGFVQAGDGVLIGGFIIDGNEPVKVLVRAIGPSLAGGGIEHPLIDPTLQLHDSNGSALTNDDWRDTQEADIAATTIAPSDDRESAVLAALTPGLYTAIVRGKDDTTGVALVELYMIE